MRLWQKIDRTKTRNEFSDVGADDVTQYLSVPLRSPKEDLL